MDLTKIVLEQVEFPDFGDLRSYWHKAQKDYQYSLFYAKITAPLVYQSYEEAIKDFFSHPKANLLGVNVEGEWSKAIVRLIKKKDIETIVEEYSATARADKYKHNFFEMKFGYGAHSNDLLTISFVELRHNVIVGHDVRAPVKMSKYLTVRRKEPVEMQQQREDNPRQSPLLDEMRDDKLEYRMLHGIWVP